MSFSYLTQKIITFSISFGQASIIAIIGASHVPVAINTFLFVVSFK
jgi:hypothetical protein